ncbi:hypothetical protein EF910_32060 [Streptomyces sp. WAC07149]|uniref:hypothetical protein n=1 Tax=Streptomyces sp. WAC07149 TaxID=2487425 RepID=UPI000F7B94C2|nr:hypothetical protein [Streptomyces sp. WAC07149]RST00371.1 hypothetical protein EF910_32060 [Streptomyces sp. WAC07149]
MPGSDLPRRTPGTSGRQPRAEAPEPIPWDAFAVTSDTAETYGQPSPALMKRARRGWKKLGNLHARVREDGPQ